MSNLFSKNLNKNKKKKMNKKNATLSLDRNINVPVKIIIKKFISIFFADLKFNRNNKLIISGSNLTIKLPNFFSSSKKLVIK